MPAPSIPPNKILIETFTPTDPYATGGISIRSAELSDVATVAILDAPEGYTARGVSASGNAFQLQVYRIRASIILSGADPSSGVSFEEIPAASNFASGKFFKALLVGR